MKTWIPVLLFSATLLGGALPAQAQQQDAATASALPRLLAQTPETPTETSASDVPSVAQQLLTLLENGDYATAGNLYDGDAVVSRSSLRTTWEDVLAVNGAYQQQTNLRTEPLSEPAGGTLAIVTAQFANGTRDLYIVFNAQNQVVSLDLVDGAEQ